MSGKENTDLSRPCRGILSHWIKAGGRLFSTGSIEEDTGRLHKRDGLELNLKVM